MNSEDRNRISPELIERAMVFPMDTVIERYAQEQDLPLEVAREHERELKRFLALHALNLESCYGMRGPIDKLWHTFITFTKEYAEFCNSVAGHFIHHIPETRVVSEQRGKAKDYERFLTDYEVAYGEPAPVHLWPRLGRTTFGMDDNLNASCGGCSGCKSCGPSCIVS